MIPHRLAVALVVFSTLALTKASAQQPDPPHTTVPFQGKAIKIYWGVIPDFFRIERVEIRKARVFHLAEEPSPEYVSESHLGSPPLSMDVFVLAFYGETRGQVPDVDLLLGSNNANFFDVKGRRICMTDSDSDYGYGGALTPPNTLDFAFMQPGEPRSMASKTADGFQMPRLFDSAQTKSYRGWVIVLLPPGHESSVSSISVVPTAMYYSTWQFGTQEEDR